MKIAFTINKGGVGKTTSLCAIAQILALAEYKVLVVDLDPQANTSRIFGIKRDIPDVNYTDLYCKQLDEEGISKFVCKSNFENIDIIPSSSQIKRMNVKVYDAKKENPMAGLHFRNNIMLIEDNYDFVLMDNAPAIDDMADCSIAAADKVIIPINTDNLSYEGIDGTIKLVQEINEKYNLDVKFGGVFMTRVKGRTTLYKDLFESFKEQFGEYFIPVSIRDCNAVAEANTVFMPLYAYSKKCTAFIDYVELISRLGLMDKKHYQILLKKTTNGNK